jgi:16S rRNA (uracil1498-N3)-methyltransferase
VLRDEAESVSYSLLCFCPSSPDFMPRVFISPHLLETGLERDEFEVPFETAKKLTRVLRLSPGEMFVAFDGLGREFDCVLAQPDEDAPKTVRAAVVSERPPAAPGSLHLSVAQAIPKGDKMEFVLLKGTELGVAEFWPFEAERSVARLSFEDDPERASARAERWRKIVEGACAQCGRADVPLVHSVADLATVVDYGTGRGRCFMLDERPEAESLRAALEREPLELSGDDPARITLLIGPEGGWTERDREWCDRYGVEAVSLGRRVLRTETAALVAAAILSWQAGELG